MTERMVIPHGSRFLVLTLDAYRAALAEGDVLMAAPTEDARPDLVDVTEVSRVLKVPRSQIYRMAREGAIPSVRVGLKYRRFSISAVRTALDRNATHDWRSGRSPKPA